MHKLNFITVDFTAQMQYFMMRIANFEPRNIKYSNLGQTYKIAANSLKNSRVLKPLWHTDRKSKTRHTIGLGVRPILFFLAPTGAQGVTMSVCLCVCLCGT